MSTQTRETVAAARIIGLAGSLRAGSFNRRLLGAVAYELPADVALEVWDGLGGVPPFNDDGGGFKARDARAALVKKCHAGVQPLDPRPAQERSGLGLPATRRGGAGG
jgi:hypothetical protein